MTEHVMVAVAGARFAARKLEGVDALSTLFWFEAICVADASPAELVGQTAQIELTANDRAQTISGIVASARRSVGDAGVIEIRLSIVPPAHRLTLGRNCRSFPGQDDARDRRRGARRSATPLGAQPRSRTLCLPRTIP